ncbi:uncharacterized protein LOC107367556 [Tetranychus urticae]|uniref:F-box domain-containing protein n=1 Tax=Tetranychus urticae TaxID=32264 RepID=T1KV38_TETUR|nr:uncharacterized protein LOC107367556 [Tetranychus urticae]XP_015790753.1 uncharacterized protein LOC107367556 [Tetranychus urticae]XP_025017739.1 uncharacterized protein LOC107367556 [Tetranychus urticae]
MDGLKKPLPDELVIKILFHCDGQTFMRCARACKRFHRIAAGMGADKSKYWYHAVKRDIEPSLISQLLLNHPVELGDKIHNLYQVLYSEASADDAIYWPARYDPWYQLYTKWFSGSQLKNKSFTRYNVDGLHNNHVAIIKQSGDLVITGHYNGAVAVHNCTSDTMTYITVHLREITGIALVNLTLHQSFKYLENAKCNHHHIISIARGGHLRCYPIFPTEETDGSSTLSTRLAEKDLNDVRVFGNQCVVQTKDAFFVLKITLPKSANRDFRSADSLITPLEISKMHTISINTNICFKATSWMNFWRNKITHVDGLTFRIDIHDSACKDWIWDYTPEFSSTLSLTGSQNKNRAVISRAFLFRDKIALFVSSTGGVYVTLDLDTIQEIPTLEHFDAGVSVISYWGSLIAFGLTNGKIYGYSVLESSKLLSLDLSDPIFVRHIDPDRGSEAIVSLDVYNSGSGYSIAASTLYSLTVFKSVG